MVCLLALAAAAGGTWWYLAATADARRAAGLVACLRGREPGTITKWLAALGWQDKLAGRTDNDIIRELIELGPAAVPSLLEMLTDHNWLARSKAAALLGTIGDRRALKPLVRMMQSDTFVGSMWSVAYTDEGSVRARAAHALGVIGDSSVTEDLVTALDDKSARVRAAAMWALSEIGDPRSVPSPHSTTRKRSKPSTQPRTTPTKPSAKRQPPP